MTIRRFFEIIAVTFLLLIIAMPVMVALLFINQRSLYACQQTRFESHELAAELGQTSDDLTRFARAYVNTGEKRFENYYHDLLAMRRGEKPRPHTYGGIYWDFIAAGEEAPVTLTDAKPFKDMLNTAGLTAGETARFKEALENAEALAKTEEIAINAAGGLFDDGTGHFSKKGPPDREMAIRLLNDDAYYREKARLMRPIAEFLASLDKRTDAETEKYTRRGRIYMTMTLGIQALLLFFLMISFTTISRILFTPIALLDNQMKSVAADLGRLAVIAQEIARGNLSQSFSVNTKPISQHSADEIGALTKTHDAMLARLQETGQSIAHITFDLSEHSARLEGSNRELEDKNDLLKKEMEERIRIEGSLRESEERNRFFSELAFEGIVIHHNGTIIDANKTFLTMFGFASIDELGDVDFLRDLIEPEYLDEVRRHINEDSSEIYNVRFHMQNGVSFWAETRGFSIDYRGKPARVATINNITLRVEAQEALRESEKKFRTISLSALDAIIMIENSGSVSYWNPAAERIFGYGKEEIIGRNLHDILAPSRYLEVVRKAFPQWQKTGEGEAVGKLMEFSAIRKDGHEIPVEMALASVQIGNAWNAIAIMRDISERKKFEKELLEARDRADRASRAKSEFLANMSHEIRTPMNAIIGFSELMKGRVKDDKSEEYLKGILAGGKNLLALIEDILDLSKIEAGKMDIRWEPANPHGLCEDIAQIFAARTAEKGIEFHIEVSPELPQGLILDEVRVRQILLNLIGNAIKFTEKGSVTLRVKTESAVADRSAIDLIFEVQDTGIGIPVNQQEMIFEAFRQQEGQSTRKFGGTGLGLTITKRLVEIMGGRLSLESEVGKGSIFRVHIPGVRLAAIVPSSVEEHSEFDAIQFEGAVILLAEDIESNRQVITGLLEPHDVVLLTAANGLEALETARRIAPDLILMDLQMPVMDGYEATTIIKSDESLKSIPVVAITASSSEHDMKKVKATLDGYLRKPVVKRALLKELARFLPHSFPGAAPHEKTGEASPSHDGDSIPVEMRDTLREGFRYRWEEVCSGMVVEEIKSFAQDLRELGKARSIHGIEEYGETLFAQASSFKIDRMMQTLERFPSFLGPEGNAETSIRQMESE
jgi:PAS domain S-box-containing protein